ncbi:hypothetical protein ACWD4O_02250 [Streptomyces sp. NPDC002623]
MAADGAGTAEIRGAPARLRRATGLPVAFGAPMEPGRQRMRISGFSGASGVAPRGPAVASGNGLGGTAVAPDRPCAVTDCSLSRRISHGYDVAVAEVREAHAGLRAPAARITDPAPRAELLDACGLLSSGARQAPPGRPRRSEREPGRSGREPGRSGREPAGLAPRERVMPTSVAAPRGPGARTWGEAVVAARRTGPLP